VSLSFIWRQNKQTNKQTMNINKITSLAAIAAISCAASGYAASNDALLDLLVKKGVLSQTEATAVAVELKEDQPVFVGVKGDAVESIKLTGRLHFQYDNFDNDDDSVQNRDRFSFRRIYLGAEAKLFDDYYGKLIMNFGGDDDSASVDKAVVGWKYDKLANFEAGYTKVPFGYYESTSSSKIKTVERSIANRLFIEGDGLAFGGRQTGLFAKGDLGAGFFYKAAVVSAQPSNSRNDDTPKSGEQDGYGGFARVQWKSDKTDNGQLLVGADLGYMQDGSLNAKGDGDLVAYGLHANYSIGDFNLSAEGLFGSVESDSGSDSDVFGLTIQPSYKINDKWEVVASYTYADADGSYLIEADDTMRKSGNKNRFDEVSSYYIGFNYYILGNDLKLSGGFEHAEYEDAEKAAVSDTGIGAFRLRLQMLF
jgi:phosphate-selective porin